MSINHLRGWDGLHPLSKALYQETYFKPKENYDNWLENRVKQDSNDEAHFERLKSYIKNYWFHPSTPPSSGRGLPISCYVSHIEDTRKGIFDGYLEGMWLGAEGGGRGVYWGDVGGAGRPIGLSKEELAELSWTEIQENKKIPKSSGTIPFFGPSDRLTYAISQAGVRRSTEAVYLRDTHPDLLSFLHIRLETGDKNRRMPNLHHGVCLSNAFMNAVKNLEPWNLVCPKTGKVTATIDAYDLWIELLTIRKTESGEPYIIFIDNVNDRTPIEYKKLGLYVYSSNICCLTGDTKVITKQGIHEIKDLVGKTVTVFDGNNWVDCNNFTEYPEDVIYRITLKNGKTIDSNAEHRWFVAESYNDINNSKYTEVKTKDLIVGTWLEDNIKEARYSGDYSLQGAYAKGFMLGDGTQDNGKPILNVHSTKYVCIPSLIKSLNELPVDDSLDAKTIKELSVSSEVVNPNQYGVQRFKRVKGLTARKQSLQHYALAGKNTRIIFEKLTIASKLELLSGILDADGCYSTSGIQVSSISKSFIESLQDLIISLGYNASVDTTEYKHRNNMYRVTIGNYDSYKLFDELSCVRLEKPETVPNRRTTGYRQITSIEVLDEKQKVYCPQIPTTKKFLLANGIMTGNTEIVTHTAPDKTTICCLGSLNLEYWDEYKDNIEQVVADLTDYLHNILIRFLKETEGREGFKKARKAVLEEYNIGLGVMGWHSLLQKKHIPFESPMAIALNKQIFKAIRKASDDHQERICTENPELICPVSKKAGTKRRNIHTLAVAPTMSISMLCDLTSSGIEPWVTNAFVKKVPTGSFSIKNKYLDAYIKDYCHNVAFAGSQNLYGPDAWIEEQWDKIVASGGSVQSLDWMDDYAKDVFKTAFEINPLAMIKQMGDRTDEVDQAVSNNIFLPAEVSYEELHTVHFKAWELGVKSLYYLRSEPEAKAETGKKERKSIELKDDVCVACT